MKRSRRGRGSRERLEATRRQAALALGRDPEQRDSYLEPPKPSSPALSTTSAGESVRVAGSGVGVLSIGEAATRLNVSRAKLEALIASGQIEALPAGFTRMIPTSDVERLRRRNVSGS